MGEWESGREEESRVEKKSRCEKKEKIEDGDHPRRHTRSHARDSMDEALKRES
jgi:hypothetical protein